MNTNNTSFVFPVIVRFTFELNFFVNRSNRSLIRVCVQIHHYEIHLEYYSLPSYPTPFPVGWNQASFWSCFKHRLQPKPIFHRGVWCVFGGDIFCVQASDWTSKKTNKKKNWHKILCRNSIFIPVAHFIDWDEFPYFNHKLHKSSQLDKGIDQCF